MQVKKGTQSKMQSDITFEHYQFSTSEQVTKDLLTFIKT